MTRVFERDREDVYKWRTHVGDSKAELVQAAV